METMSKRRKEEGNNSRQETRQNETGGVDRISSLPDHLLHFIMFMLCTDEIVRLSILSKRWKVVQATFPVIDLDEANYICGHHFLHGMQLCLSQHHMANLQKLRLRTIRPLNDEIYHLIDRFIRTAIMGNVQSLHLQFYAEWAPNQMKNVFGRFYVLPEVIFSQGSSLVNLKVVGCDFGSYRVLNLSFLRTLSIKNVRVEEDLLQRLVHACPSLETLSLQYFHGLKGIKIFHENMRKFSLWVNEELEAMDINLPNLQSFKYKGYHKLLEGYMAASKFDILNKIEVHKLRDSFCLMYIKLEVEAFQNIIFKHLRRLVLHYIDVNDGAFWFYKLKFPSLESLSLEGCKGLKNVKVISSKIRDLVIIDCADIQYCKILAPNLLCFKYQGPMLNVSRLLTSEKVEVYLKFWDQDPNHRHDALQLGQMRDFLKAFFSVNEMTMTLAFDCHECMGMLKELYNKSPLNYVQNLKVKLRTREIGLIGHFLRPNKAVLFDLLHCSLSISRCYNTLSISFDSLQMKFEFRGGNKQKFSGTSSFWATSLGFPLTNVEKVWISGFSGCDEETRLLNYVVLKAMYLKYISICMTGETSLAAQIAYSNLKAWKGGLAETFPVLQIELIP